MTGKLLSSGLLALALGVGCGQVFAQTYGAAPNQAAPPRQGSASQSDWLAYLPQNGGGGDSRGSGGAAAYPGYQANEFPGAVPHHGPAAQAPAYPGCETGECYPGPGYEVPCTEVYQPRPSGAVWGGSVAGLLLNVHTGQHYNFSYDDANEARQFTDWYDVRSEWDGCFEVSLGCFDACTGNGLQVVYWQLFADPETTNTTSADAAGNLNGILNWDQLDYDGATADTYVNNAMAHRLRREVDVQNAEINGLATFSGGGCSTSRVSAVYGARFLRFEDQMQFASDTVDGMFTNMPEDLYYDVDTENLMFGLQAGLWGEYCLSPRWQLVVGGKAGVFGNLITADSRIGGAAGTATINNGPNNGRAFRVDADKTDLAMLGELQGNLQYSITPHWHAAIGYRIIGISGVAVSVDQVYHDLRGLQDVEQVDSHGTLLLHGVQSYVAWNF